jgi:hypothetical protein
MPNQYSGKEIASNFWSACDRSGGPDACWPWLRATDSSGYGNVSVAGKTVSAHRYAYELTHGEIPKSFLTKHGTVVMHDCDNPPCINPKHLILNSQLGNVADRHRKRRNFRPKGELNAWSKLTVEDIEKIRGCLKVGMSYNVVGKKFGVNKSTIASINKSKTWGWLKTTGERP